MYYNCERFLNNIAVEWLGPLICIPDAPSISQRPVIPTQIFTVSLSSSRQILEQKAPLKSGHSRLHLTSFTIHGNTSSAFTSVIKIIEKLYLYFGQLWFVSTVKKFSIIFGQIYLLVNESILFKLGNIDSRIL